MMLVGTTRRTCLRIRRSLWLAALATALLSGCGRVADSVDSERDDAGRGGSDAASCVCDSPPPHVCLTDNVARAYAPSGTCTDTG